MDRLFILAIAIVIAGALSGGVYTSAGSGSGGVVITNKFTGSSTFCATTVCRPMQLNLN